MATCTPSWVPGKGKQSHGHHPWDSPCGGDTRHSVPLPWLPQEGVCTQDTWVAGDGQEAKQIQPPPPHHTPLSHHISE